MLWLVGPIAQLQGGTTHCIVMEDLQNYFCLMAEKCLEEGCLFKKIIQNLQSSEQQG